MKEQVIQAKQIPPLKGIAIVLLIVFGLMAASAVSNLLIGSSNRTVASGIVFVLALFVAIYLMREHIMQYRYTVNQGSLYLERSFGQRTKVLDAFAVLDIVAIGEEKELREKYPQINNAMNLTMKGCPIPKKAVVYAKGGQYQMAIMQPDEEMLALLWDEETRRKNREEKWGEA